jgi:hypothetical protein
MAAPAFAAFTGGPFTWNGNALDAVAQVDLDWTSVGMANGGPYSVNVISGSLAPSLYDGMTGNGVFETFCAESDIGFVNTQTYWVSVDPVVLSGGVGAAGDPVSDVAEYIYDRYRAGNPDSWDATQIGEAIWWAEEETQGVKNSIVDDALAALGYASNVTASALGNGVHTWGMNLWVVDDQGVATDKQSFLVTVPVPAGALLGFLGLAVAGIKLRRSV